MPPEYIAPSPIRAGLEHALHNFQLAIETVGEKKNYNLDSGSEYELWPFSTIEWKAAQDKYQARVLLTEKATGDVVAINSWHQDFADAERAIALVTDGISGVGDRRAYNVFGETIEIHTSPSNGKQIQVIEVQGLIWSMQQVSGP